MRNTTLVIMAAGIGSRFGGGIKQLEPVGPNGEIIMDYSIYDALEAGFNRIVFVIRRDLERDFKEIIGNRISQIADVEYAYQELDDLPCGFVRPAERTKPWGTGQAILSVKDLVQDPFLVINADDYYGKEGFQKIHQYMTETMNLDGEIYDMCMGGFILVNTLSENGGVTRGVCQMNQDGTLKAVTETYQIEKKGDKIFALDGAGNPALVGLFQHVSMNMWGLPPRFLQELETGFSEFLKDMKPGDVKSEYLLPVIIDRLIQSGKARVKMLETRDRWFGVTYREDKEMVTTAIRDLIAAGKYPEKLY